MGEIHRHGQGRNTSCCGAAKGALGKLTRDQIVEGRVSELDHQMNTLEQILFKQRDRILEAELPLKEATEVIYEAIDQRIEELVALTKYTCKYVILFGAIHINSDTDLGSYTSPKRFTVIDLATGEKSERVDIMNALCGL